MIRTDSHSETLLENEVDWSFFIYESGCAPLIRRTETHIEVFVTADAYYPTVALQAITVLVYASSTQLTILLTQIHPDMFLTQVDPDQQQK